MTFFYMYIFVHAKTHNSEKNQKITWEFNCMIAVLY